MQHKILFTITFAIAAILEVYGGYKLLYLDGSNEQLVFWILLHTLSSILAVIPAFILVPENCQASPRSIALWLFLFAFFMPVVGVFGIVLGFALGLRLENFIDEADIYWKITPQVPLPYSPQFLDRKKGIDTRGFIEQIKHQEESADLFNKVVATRNMKDAQSAPILRQALKHPGEKIRLVSYAMLERKIAKINNQINKLEKKLKGSNKAVKVNTYLQLSRNYWELISLEDGDKNVKAQVLHKAKEHALSALRIDFTNMNAHFILGQIEMRAGNHRNATKAFKHSIKYGFSVDKVMPYLAEVAYQQRDFERLKKYLKMMEPAHRAYPPIAGVGKYWLTE